MEQVAVCVKGLVAVDVIGCFVVERDVVKWSDVVVFHVPHRQQKFVLIAVGIVLPEKVADQVCGWNECELRCDEGALPLVFRCIV